MKLPQPAESGHANGLYLRLLKQIFESGEKTKPRGESTLEVRPLIFRLTEPHNRLVTLAARKVNPAFALIEAFQLIAGVTDGAQQVRFNANIKNWLGQDDGQIEAPYGVLIRDQLPKMLSLLQKDSDSRQAVLTIYDGKVHFREMLNVPCTCSFQFFVRNAKLEMIVYMRSNDLWWGLPYDIFQFTALQEVVAAALNYPMGDYTHIAGSGHLYERHYEAAHELIKVGATRRDFRPQDFLFGDSDEHLDYGYIMRGIEDVLNVECRVAAGEITKEDAVMLVELPFVKHLSILLARQRLDR